MDEDSSLTTHIPSIRDAVYVMYKKHAIEYQVICHILLIKVPVEFSLFEPCFWRINASTRINVPLKVREFDKRPERIFVKIRFPAEVLSALTTHFQVTRLPFGCSKLSPQFSFKQCLNFWVLWHSSVSYLRVLNHKFF